jgi:tetratricopeptide (TPR) repeat protein
MKSPIDRGPWLIAFALVVATIAVYAPARHFDFVNYDDNDYVYANPIVTPGMTASGVKAAFAGHRAGHWHPLTWISHMTDVELFGVDPGAHHLVNVALHVVNALLLFGVLAFATGAAGRSAAVAGLFALHPLNVETVAWVTQRKNLLSTTMWLLAIGAYVLWARRRKRAYYALVLLFFVAGLLSKAMVVTLPATLLALDVWPLRRADLAMLRDRAHRRELAALITEKLPLFFLSLVAALAAYVAQKGADAVAASYPFAERLLNAFVSLGWYLQKSVIPTDLTVLNPHPASVGTLVSRPLAIASLAVFILLVFTAGRFATRRPWILAGLGWYFVTLLPVSGIIQVGEQAHGDHFAYVPLIGVFVAVVWTVADSLKSALHVRLAAIAACVVLVLAATAARTQLFTWRDSVALYSRALEVHGPNIFIARKNLAAHYSELGSRAKAAGEPLKALELFRAASALHAEPGVLYNEAAALSDLHRYREAIPLYIRSLELDPENSDGWLNLGDAQVVTGNYPAAVHSYRRVLSMRPDKYADYGLAFACARTGDATCSNTSLRRLASVDPQLAGDAVAMIAR